MAKGIGVKFKSYTETVPAFLKYIKFDNEIRGKKKIVIKPSLKNANSHNTSAAFAEQIVRFCLQNKDEDASIFIAEGSDGEDTSEVFEMMGYTKLAERYPISLIDLNTSETTEKYHPDFLKHELINYPEILLDSYVISLPRLTNDEEITMQGSISNMIGAFPASHYTGFFSSTKNKINKWPVKFSIHDIILCKMPDAAIIDASDYGYLLAGRPLDIDKEAARIIGKDWKGIPYLRLVNESIEQIRIVQEEREIARAKKEEEQ